MTRGRLQTIERMLGINEPAQSLESKYCRELVAEVHRLRDILTYITTADDTDHLQETARNALADPDMGPPDIVCRR